MIARGRELAALLARVELFRCGLQNFTTSDPTLNLCASGIQGAGTSEPGKWPSRTTKRRPFATRRSQLPTQRDCSFLKPPGHACIWALPVARGLPSRDRLPQCPSIMVRERFGMGTYSGFWKGRDDSGNGKFPTRRGVWHHIALAAPCCSLPHARPRKRCAPSRSACTV